MIAVCAVLFGVIFLGATYAGGMLYGILAPVGMASLGYEPFYGIYFLGGAFALYVMRKPGTGIIAEILAAVIETLLGNFFGPIIILWVLCRDSDSNWSSRSKSTKNGTS